MIHHAGQGAYMSSSAGFIQGSAWFLITWIRFVSRFPHDSTVHGSMPDRTACYEELGGTAHAVMPAIGNFSTPRQINLLTRYWLSSARYSVYFPCVFFHALVGPVTVSAETETEDHEQKNSCPQFKETKFQTLCQYSKQNRPRAHDNAQFNRQASNTGWLRHTN